MNWLVTTATKRTTDDDFIRHTDQTSRLVRVSDVMWVVSTFCDETTLGSLACTCRSNYEVIDDSVWRVLAQSKYIAQLPRTFASWKLYYRYASRGEGMESGALECPFSTPLDAMVNLKGNVASCNLISAREPILRFLKTGKAAAILLARPEHCHVGITTSTTIRGCSAMWGADFHLWALAYLLPGATIEMSIIEEGGQRYLQVERLGMLLPEIVLREPLPLWTVGKPVYFIMSIGANFGSFAAI